MHNIADVLQDASYSGGSEGVFHIVWESYLRISFPGNLRNTTEPQELQERSSSRKRGKEGVPSE
jgi:hypothetical protein